MNEFDARCATCNHPVRFDYRQGKWVHEDYICGRELVTVRWPKSGLNVWTVAPRPYPKIR
ncbi:MAG: hypothetical protein R3324_02660 [Halobacteriales archaeon]|nr:hypothetical protein [Halobacteriales archaeon]